VNRQRGTLGDLVPLIEQAAAHLQPGSASELALANMYAGPTDEARRLLAEFAAEDFDLPAEAGWSLWMVDYANAAIKCRDTTFAGALLERLAPFAAQFAGGDIWPKGPVSLVLGGLAGWGEGGGSQWLLDRCRPCRRLVAMIRAIPPNLLRGPAAISETFSQELLSGVRVASEGPPPGWCHDPQGGRMMSMPRKVMADDQLAEHVAVLASPVPEGEREELSRCLGRGWSVVDIREAPPEAELIVVRRCGHQALARLRRGVPVAHIAVEDGAMPGIPQNFQALPWLSIS